MSFYNSKSLLNEFPNLDWTPSLSAKIDPQKKSLHVTFNDYEFDISAHSYSINDIRKIMNKYFYIEEISSFPTLSSILPNSILKNSRIKKIVKLVDYELRYNNVYGGHYINVICRKK